MRSLDELRHGWARATAEQRAAFLAEVRRLALPLPAVQDGRKGRRCCYRVDGVAPTLFQAIWEQWR
jgi:hypothetical protein